MRAFLICLAIVFVATFGGFIGWRITQLSDDAFGMLLMAGCLSPVVILAMLALVYSMVRRDRLTADQPGGRPALPAAPNQYPPVIVVSGGQTPYQWQHQASLPPPNGPRRFEVVGEDVTEGDYK